MARRGLLLIGTIAWLVGYLATYLVILHQQESSPAWWYVALLIVAIGMLGSVVAGRLGRRTLLAAAAVIGFATLIALLSIGIFLVPALVGVSIAASAAEPATR
jgi:cytochrome bd-type quinol oxidase subunit 2